MPVGVIWRYAVVTIRRVGLLQAMVFFSADLCGQLGTWLIWGVSRWECFGLLYAMHVRFHFVLFLSIFYICDFAQPALTYLSWLRARQDRAESLFSMAGSK